LIPVGHTIDHIDKAQAALQNRDIETALSHLDLAKQTLEEYNSNVIKPVNLDMVITKWVSYRTRRT
jgi:hypothetical protein